MGKLQGRLGDQLSLYVRHLAWLQATPKPPAGSKRAKHFDQANALSRIDELKKNKVVPPMPPNPAPHMIERLIEIGLSEAAGMAAVPVSWVTIEAWQRITGTALAAWEARLIRRLSSDYLASSRLAESENCPPPWRAPVTEREIETEVQRLEMVLG